MGADLANLMLGITTVLGFVPYCLAGLLLGMVSGVLPGIGPTAMIAMLIPITFAFPPVGTIILLASVYNGAQHGSALAAILASSSESIATGGPSTDGRRMAWQGQAGRAITVSAISSIIAATLVTIAIAYFSPAVAAFGSALGPAELFSATVLTLTVALMLSRGALLIALGMVILGLLLGIVGTDMQTGQLRLTFGAIELADGISVIVIAIGAFAIGETIAAIQRDDRRGVVLRQVKSLLPMPNDLVRIIPSVLRGSFFGSLLGLLPGAGPAFASYGSYEIERLTSKHGKEIGQGVVEGVAAPAAANKAGLQSSFIPMLAFGIPSNAAMALLISGLMIHGIMPGPGLLTNQPQLFWGLISSVWLGSVLMAVLSLILIRGWIRILDVPYQLLYPSVLGFCAISVYSVSNSVFDVYLMCVFGLLGYIFKRLGSDPTPMLISFVVAPLFEENFRKAMILSKDDYSIFLSRPLSSAMLASAVVLLALIAIFLRSRNEHYVE
ncbi:MAG: tripartite tricarboxylate transporter permease [Hyphomicrobiaceae bacterium]